MIESKIAPIIIPTLNRYEHLRACIKSLSCNELALESDIYISVDYPSSKKHLDGYNRIREFLDKGIVGFKEVHVIYQKENLGALGNYDFLVDYITKRYERYIYTEDDTVVSKNFLLYMNDCLTRYESDDRIVGICGYSQNVNWKNKKSSVQMINNEFNCWGYASWSNKVKEMKTYITDGELEKALNNNFIRHVICKSRPDYIPYIIKYIKGDNTVMSGESGLRMIDITKTMYMIVEGRMTVMPTVTKVINEGFDGTGANCKKTDFMQQVLDVFDGWEYDDTEIGNEIDNNSKLIRSHFIKQKLLLNYEKIIGILKK